MCIPPPWRGQKPSRMRCRKAKETRKKNQQTTNKWEKKAFDLPFLGIQVKPNIEKNFAILRARFNKYAYCVTKKKNEMTKIDKKMVREIRSKMRKILKWSKIPVRNKHPKSFSEVEKHKHKKCVCAPPSTKRWSGGGGSISSQTTWDSRMKGGGLATK